VGGAVRTAVLAVQKAAKLWEDGGLKILEKSGDLSEPNNYRGTMLLEVAMEVDAKQRAEGAMGRDLGGAAARGAAWTAPTTCALCCER
jgi:hypothetical protein